MNSHPKETTPTELEKLLKLHKIPIDPIINSSAFGYMDEYKNNLAGAIDALSSLIGECIPEVMTRDDALLEKGWVDDEHWAYNEAIDAMKDNLIKKGFKL